MTIRLLALLSMPLLALSACATPESRVQTALIDAGLSRPVASCMAERLVDRLSTAQLRRLASLSRGQRIEEMSVGELLDRVRGLQDPEILAVVTRAGIGCAIAG